MLALHYVIIQISVWDVFCSTYSPSIYLQKMIYVKCDFFGLMLFIQYGRYVWLDTQKCIVYDHIVYGPTVQYINLPTFSGSSSSVVKYFVSRYIDLSFPMFSKLIYGCEE